MVDLSHLTCNQSRNSINIPGTCYPNNVAENQSNMPESDRVDVVEGQ